MAELTTTHGAAVPGARLMGELARGTARWEVYLETAPLPEGAAAHGRLHFVQAERRRTTTWIFLEHTERDVSERFADFSSVELWALLESLAP
jgi:hypothetical protein